MHTKFDNPKLQEAIKTLSPFVDDMLRSFHKECEKLPPPPPGMRYVPKVGEAHPDGNGNLIVDMTIDLQPIIKTED